MESLVNGLLDFFIAIFTIITTPIQTLIDNYMPSFNEFAGEVGSYFAIVDTQWIPWIKDLLFIPQWTFDLIFGYIIFLFVGVVSINVIKLILKYWNVLVP